MKWYSPAKTKGPTAIEAAEELLLRRAARERLLQFCGYTLSDYQPADHLVQLADKLEAVERGEIKRLMVFMPPRHGKTEQASIRFPAWYLGKHPQHSIIGCSYAEGLAYTVSSAVRDTIGSPKYQRLWSHQLDQSGAVHWRLKEKQDLRPSYIAAGVGGGITGQGADVLLIDDPVKSAEEASSATIQERNYDWYRMVARTRLAPNAAIVLIQTRWHLNDLAGRILAEAKANPEADQWVVLSLPAIQDGKALWPERYPLAVLQTTRASIGSRAFEALYQCSPSQAEGNVFKREWWKFYRARPAFEYIIHSWDTAFKAKAGNDYSVCTVWGVTDTGYYLLEVLRERLEMPELKRLCTIGYERDHPNDVLIEDAASGQSLIQEIKRESRMPIRPVKVDSDKVSRAYAVTPLIEAGRVYLPEYAPWLSSYIEELSAFPNGEHDDMVDSTTQALRHLANPVSYGFSFAGGVN